MDGEVKSNKYLMNQPASVHSYTKLNKSESPRTHTSPTSILRKFPHSLRHDQKHQTKIKRNSSPVAMVKYGEATKNGRGAKSRSPVREREGIESEPEESAAPSETVPVESDARCGAECFDRKSNGSADASVRESSDSVRCGGPEDANSSRKDVVSSTSQVNAGFTSCEQRESRQADRIKIGSYKKLSVIKNSLNECKSEKFWWNSVDKIPEFNTKILSPVHKSTPNLLRSESFGVSDSVSHPYRIADRLSKIECFDGSDSLRDRIDDNRGTSGRQQVPLKGSGSLPQLNHKYRIIHSILPKISRTISESPEHSKSLTDRDSRIDSNLFSDAEIDRCSSFRLLEGADFSDDFIHKRDGSDEEIERIGLIEDDRNPRIEIRPADDRRESKSRKKSVEIMPSLKSLVVSRRNRGIGGVAKACDVRSPGISVPLMTTPPTPTSGSCSSLNSPVIFHEEDGLPIKKCDTMFALTDLFPAESSLQIEPMKPINRLRVPPNGFYGSASRMCSRCSSLLSMASSSRYSINTTGSGFIPCSPTSEKPPEPIMLCKLCLLEVPISQSLEINHCGCVFCRDCMRLYVEFEIQEGAYDISCPDAQCHKQGIVTISEVELLVTMQMMERYMRFRLNHEVDLDRNRTWCPRAGCETVCNICPREKCSPTSVHCPTCDSDFCSNCKNPWHSGLTCEENSKKLAREGHVDFMEPGIPFDSDLIKCCPMCNVPIEKDEGCAQMMCKRCKHVFCWYCLASLDDDFLLRHYDKGPCKNKLGHSRASVIWHRTQVIGIFAGFGILLLVASPLLLVAAPCIVCCKCRVCSGTKMDPDEDLPEESGT